jgi:hypothetical protein
MKTDTMGVYGNYYLKRAVISLIGLGANQPEDAIYPLNIGDSEGKPLAGENGYVLHFGKDELPPVDAFWSITMYDASGFQVANPIDSYAISDRDQLKYNTDGSLDICIQHSSPMLARNPTGSRSCDRYVGHHHAPLRAKDCSPLRTLGPPGGPESRKHR